MLSSVWGSPVNSTTLGCFDIILAATRSILVTIFSITIQCLEGLLRHAHSNWDCHFHAMQLTNHYQAGSSQDLHLPTGFMQTLTLFHYDQVQDTQVCINDAAADRLAFSLAGSPGAVAGMALAEQQADTAVSQDTLLHGEALLVVATAYPDNITLQKQKRF